ncbi:hypothetical protein [Caulobacter sp. BK020]|uniref:hypothetical protein n=1 Tax=Caulobacter sp. BK020 TaxID=2512117 RepID=UPI0010536FD8|nr:hypothetical protein [Caulobacter sp. BK020]TCS13326.1 hypothetical protein EV278_110195 [Caulobacter sp. BK020]
MLLSALLLVAAVQATPSESLAAGRPTFYGSGPEAVEAVATNRACQTSGLDYAMNVAPTTRAAVKKLGDLSPANHTLTVLRSIDGCPVSSTVRFNVDRPAGR